MDNQFVILSSVSQIQIVDYATLKLFKNNISSLVSFFLSCNRFKATWILKTFSKCNAEAQKKEQCVFKLHGVKQIFEFDFE